MKREVWLDFLRVTACLMVMVIHSTEPFYLGGEGGLILSATDAFWVAVFEGICRCCVPVFLVASAYLQFPLHYSTGEFFRRRAVRILVPMVIWTVVYALAFGDPVQNFKGLLLNFNYTPTPEHYMEGHSNITINYIHGRLDDPQSVIFGYGDELDENYKRLKEHNDSECMRHVKSIRYLEHDNYRRMLEFIESDPFQVVIMGHSCGNSDRTLLNTIFEHPNCVSIKPYYYQKDEGSDNYNELVMNISRNFTDMKLMRDWVVNKEYTEPLTNSMK